MPGVVQPKSLSSEPAQQMNRFRRPVISPGAEAALYGLLFRRVRSLRFARLKDRMERRSSANPPVASACTCEAKASKRATEALLQPTVRRSSSFHNAEAAGETDRLAAPRRVILSSQGPGHSPTPPCVCSDQEPTPVTSPSRPDAPSITSPVSADTACLADLPTESSTRPGRPSLRYRNHRTARASESHPSGTQHAA